MELSADLQTELLGLFEEILATDEHTVELPQATRIVGGCSRLQSVLAAREATFAPIMRRLELRAAQAALASKDGAGNGAGNDADDAAQGASDGPPLGLDGSGAAASPAPSGSAPPGGAPPPVVPRVSAREQRRRDARSRWLTAFELFAAAFNAGRVSPEHADVLAAACERLEEWVLIELQLREVRLVADAERLGPEGLAASITDIVESIRDDRGQTLFQRQLAEARAWLRFDRASGLYHLHAILDPQRGELLQSVLDQRIAQLQADTANSGVPYGQLVLRALLDLIHGDVAATSRAVVVVDERTARTGMQHPDTVCENIDGARLPIDLALAACVSGKVTAAILDRAGKPADLSSSQPLATAEQRVELRAMYRECVHPDCATPFSRCHQHHVVYREHGGRTTVSNFVPACSKHHHDIHDRGWRLTIDAERTLRWYRPDGSPYAELPQTRLDGRGTTRADDVPGAVSSAERRPEADAEAEADRRAASAPTGGAPPLPTPVPGASPSAEPPDPAAHSASPPRPSRPRQRRPPDPVPRPAPPRPPSPTRQETPSPASSSAPPDAPSPTLRETPSPASSSAPDAPSPTRREPAEAGARAVPPGGSGGTSRVAWGAPGGEEASDSDAGADGAGASSGERPADEPPRHQRRGRAA
jgi:hypothetical protein